MNFFELQDLKLILKHIDNKNENDLTSFKNMLTNKLDDKALVKQIIAYLENDLAVYADAEISDLTEYELESLVNFINNKGSYAASSL